MRDIKKRSGFLCLILLLTACFGLCGAEESAPKPTDVSFVLHVITPAPGSEAQTIVFQDAVRVSTSAEYVDLGNVKVQSIGSLIRFLQKLPNLKKVDMFATPVYAGDIKQLTEALPNVEFGWTMCIDCNNPHHSDRNKHLIRTDATAFSTLHNSQCRAHSSQDFEILKYCKNLLALDIGHNAVTSLDFLQYLPKLRVLIIGRNAVTDLSPIKNCPDLEYLEAFSNQIRSVEPLLSCSHLMDLNIPNNKIKDPELLARMTSLKRLWAFNYGWSSVLNQDKVPFEIKNLLKKALPDTVINWYSGGTDGWREPHKHSYVIKEMFDTGVYIPFEDSY